MDGRVSFGGSGVSEGQVGAEVSSQGKGLVTRWTVIVVWAVRRFLEGFGAVGGPGVR